MGESIFFGHEPRLCGIAIEWRAMKAQHKRRCVASLASAFDNPPRMSDSSEEYVLDQ
ncbi:hypothetical protein [Caballeronia udeis]|uniref:hypothetical protein n=1 Tax=Caballeronia udeis TaxID=1232866 RepID=UPI000A741516|nr:hypothetical protein [Caballeronia udeis]